MDHKVYKLSFPNGVHIGNGELSQSDLSVHSDTLFSAICIEALAIGGENMLKYIVNAAKTDKLLISDAMPYIGKYMYIPKPMCRIKGEDNDSAKKKAFKKLSYIQWRIIDDYLCGVNDPEQLCDEFKELGVLDKHQKVRIDPYDKNELYTVGSYRFNDNNGLYFIVGFGDTELESMFEEIMSSLKYTGIGGKRSSGCGRFEYVKRDLKNKRGLDSDGGRYISISTCMAKDDELEAVLDGASYKLIKRSGYIQSGTYSEKQLKKRDTYMFAPGSVFKKKFSGEVFDVSIEGAHPVYRYAKPMLIAIGDAL